MSRHDDLTGGPAMRPQERRPIGPMARHNLEPVSLVFGFAFTGLGLLFLIGQADQALRVRWIWPVLLLVLGAGILLDVTRNRGRTDPEATPIPETALAPEPEPDLASEPDPDPTPGPDPDPTPWPDPDPEVAVDSREQPK